MPVVVELQRGALAEPPCAEGADLCVTFKEDLSAAVWWFDPGTVTHRRHIGQITSSPGFAQPVGIAVVQSGHFIRIVASTIVRHRTLSHCTETVTITRYGQSLAPHNPQIDPSVPLAA
jgi:hypothetical protein